MAILIVAVFPSRLSRYSHRVICGNAADPDLINRLMRTDIARMVLTDAPFPIAIERHETASDHREDGTVSEVMINAQLLEFNRDWMNAVFPHVMDGGLFGTFIGWRDLPLAHAVATALGITPIDLVVWANANAIPGGLFRSQYRLLPLFKKGSAAHVNNSSDGKRGRHRTNLWTYSAPSIGSDARRGRPDLPNMKPTSMLEDALTDLTNRGEFVLDPFLGFGSTLIAAENTGRVCCGVELDPLYVDVIIRRYEASTGTSAILADIGETFEEIAAGRRDDERRH
jgi:DNA modification methylase